MTLYGRNILKIKTKGWLRKLAVGDQALLSDMNIDKAEYPLKDRRLLIGELSHSLNVSTQRVHNIITVELGKSRVCPRLVHHHISKVKFSPLQALEALRVVRG
jgi:hypothetical protein